MLATELLELSAMVALVPVKHEESVYAFRARQRILLEMLKPLIPYLVRGPSVIAYSNLPVT
jgi:hypothetical protein